MANQFLTRMSVSSKFQSSLHCWFFISKFSKQAKNFCTKPSLSSTLLRLSSSSLSSSSRFLLTHYKHALFTAHMCNKSHHENCQSFNSMNLSTTGKCIHTSHGSSSSSHSNVRAEKGINEMNTVELLEDNLVLHRGNEMRQLPLVWLRDHCRCSLCYNHKTSQKENVSVNPLDPERIGVSRVVLEDENTKLVVNWKDNHVSTYSIDWLMTNSYSANAIATVHRFLWDGNSFKRGSLLPSVSYASLLDTEEGLRQTLNNLVQYGFSFITEAPASLEGTKIATDRVAPVQETLFGGMWELMSDNSRSDTAYNTGLLRAHTDNTYLEMPAGIQVFQCLQNDGNGGETLLVDGFHAVEKLRQSNPEAVRCLSSHLVPHEYKEAPQNGGSPGYHMYTLCPVIRQHPTTGEILHLRFNPYDRAPLNTIPPDDMAEFYRSYHLLSTAIADPKGQLWVKLEPGNIVLIDNWRVMHGRSPFDGKRVLCGCYLRRDEWVSKVRMMGLTSMG